jgi:hypothetical protein
MKAPAVFTVEAMTLGEIRTALDDADERIRELRDQLNQRSQDLVDLLPPGTFAHEIDASWPRVLRAVAAALRRLT